MGMRNPVGVMDVFSNWMVVMVAYLSRLYKDHGLVHLKWVNFTICELHHDKVVFKKIMGTESSTILITPRLPDKAAEMSNVSTKSFRWG